jgi:hypothetical protein
MWKANQSHGLHIASLSILTIHWLLENCKKTLKKNKTKKKTKQKLPTNLVIHHILKPTMEKFPSKVCVCERERERENFGTKVCMYVCM